MKTKFYYKDHRAFALRSHRCVSLPACLSNPPCFPPFG